ncbi:MAG: glycerophosphodiester phosphodiesterase family protein [Candidatus Margulisiibacteriota bacterium]|nr:glycerophosphodiester phosphodiesterase family protein [Candidatus Margulisiibacteriota bacterium]
MIGNIHRIMHKVGYVVKQTIKKADLTTTPYSQTYQSNSQTYKETLTMDYQVQNPYQLYIAHRGSYQNKCVENTMMAFKETYNSLSNELHGFECDFRQLNSKDKTSWVIFHDDDMVRLNGTKQIDVRSILYQDIFLSTIPTLDEFCNWISTLTSPIIINIEIKKGDANGIEYLVESLTSANMNNSVTFVYSSFEKSALETLSKLNLNQLGFLFDEQSVLTINYEDLKQYQFIATSFDCYQQNKKEIQELNKPIGVYFTDSNRYMEQLEQLKLDPFVSLIFIEN